MHNNHGSQDEIDAALHEHSDAAQTFHTDMEITEFLSIIFIVPSRIFLEMIFALRTKRRFVLLTFINFFDSALAIVFSIRLGCEYTHYQDGLDNYSDEDKKNVRYFENMYEFRDDEIMLNVLYTLASGILWIKILYIFKLTQFLGPFLKMIYSMLNDIAIFMIFFTIILIVYGCKGNLLFYTDDDYDNLYDSILTLFTISVGKIDGNSLNSTNKGKLVGQFYITSFIVLCNILIINLLIAILSSTYYRPEESNKVL